MKLITSILIFTFASCASKQQVPNGSEYRNDATLISIPQLSTSNDSAELLVSNTNTETQPVQSNLKSTPAKNPQDTLLNNIQLKIRQASNEGFMVRNDQRISKLIQELNSKYQTKKQNLLLYWKSYALYYKCIIQMQNKNMNEAEKALDEALETLENMERKNSDDYALLALLKGLSFQFKSGMKAPFISKEIKNHLETAVELDSLNIRAYYVKGSNDYYTPKNFGGRKNVEQYLKKAIALPEQVVPSIYLPSWGKEEAYEMLIKYYIEEQRWEDAKKYFAEGNSKYPNNYMINQLATKLVGK